MYQTINSSFTESSKKLKDQTAVDAAKAKRAEEARKRIAAIKASFKKGQKSDITFEAGFFKVKYLS